MQLAKAVGVTRTALNNYIKGETATQDRVRARIASYYLRVQSGKVRLEDLKKPKKQRARKPRLVAETRAGYVPGTLEARLKQKLPSTREAAVAWVVQLREMVRAHPDEAPPNAEDVVEELLRLAESLPPAEPPPG